MWNKNDLLAIALKNKNNELIGYISCDSPKDGLRPTTEDMQILSVLGKIISMILVHGEHFKEIKKLSETDYLTGLYNSSKLNKDLQMYEREKKLISVAFIDLDNFKKINDRYGHLKGDLLLKDFSDILKNSIRSNDKAYRYGEMSS
nr:GGDEF domain-containing protein [Marinitoga lauensis]